MMIVSFKISDFMSKIYKTLALLLLLSACIERKYQDNIKAPDSTSIQAEKPYLEEASANSIKSNTGDYIHKKDTSMLEAFTDSTSIGIKRQNKIEIRLYEVSLIDKIIGNYVVIDFYTRNRAGWKKKNHFQFDKDRLTGSEPSISDYNNDGYFDFTYKATVAARGGNDVRRLFIYSKEADNLILIKNSMDYPNMMYNRGLNCIDAMLIHSCSSQAFLKIESDSLKLFAWIEITEEAVYVYEYDNRGKRKEILKDKNYECYTRFKSYSPLIECLPNDYNTSGFLDPSYRREE